MKAVRDQLSCQNPMVSVVMITYNHEAFVAKAIDSVLMQETDFPVEIVIGEDCSTDGTLRVVEKYRQSYPGSIVLLKTERNLGIHANAARTLEAAKGRYIAILEGDDFWMDKEKLQLQVALLEKDKTLSMCGHTTLSFDQLKGAFTVEYPAPEARAPIHGPKSYVKFQCFTRTSSAVLRASMTADLAALTSGLKMGDWPLFMLASLRGPVGFIDRVMSCYRIHGGGVWTSVSGAAQCAAVMEMWERMLPLLPGEVAALAREDLNNLYLDALSQPDNGRAPGRWRLAWRWLWSSVKSGSLRRRKVSYVLSRLCPLLLRFRRDPVLTPH
jgi:hypothetical protein